MDGAGAGLGVFIQYMGQALPVLLIILAMVGIIVAVGYGIAHVVKGSITSVNRR
jgi:F0F1-type ATP synthase assembly protein I